MSNIEVVCRQTLHCFEAKIYFKLVFYTVAYLSSASFFFHLVSICPFAVPHANALVRTRDYLIPWRTV